MIAPGNALLQALVAIAFIIASGYALGRIHQWYRDGTARDQAYRNGYDLASDGMFDMAMRKLAEGAGAVPTLPVRTARTGDTPPLGARLVTVVAKIDDAQPTAKLVGHSRRRMVTGQFG